MIAQSTIQNVTEEAQVFDVVGEFVNLKKRGANYLGLCPFHDEKTPSFTVSPTKNIYKCFGCGKAGGAVGFVMEHENMSFPDAIRYLAEKLNIEVEETKPSPEAQQQRDENESIYILNGFAQRFFTNSLMSSEEGRSVGLSYFKERGFNQRVIEDFLLGYAPESGTALVEAALKEGYQKEFLLKAGLARERDGRLYDFYRGRVMFPIRNLSGKVVGFGGRILKADKKAPKYINTAESDIYQKSKLLYGAFLAKKSIREQDACLLVEGYTDVVSLNQGGIEHVVASSGTSLTVGQIKLIKRFTNHIHILFDGDAAGLKAALRGVDLIVQEGLFVKIVALPEGEDPDSVVRRDGGEALREYIDNNKKDFILFKADLLLKEAEDDPVKRSGVLKEIVHTIALVPDIILRNEYVRECSNRLDVSEQILHAEINKQRAQKRRDAERRQQRVEANEEPPIPAEDLTDVHAEQMVSYTDDRVGFERQILRLLMEYGCWELEADIAVRIYVLKELEGLVFVGEDTASVLEKIAAINGDQDMTETHYLSHTDEGIRNMAIELLTSPYELSENWSEKYRIYTADKKEIFKKDIRLIISRYKLLRLLELIDENQRKIQTIKDEEQLNKQLRVHKKLIDMKAELSEIIGVTVFGKRK